MVHAPTIKSDAESSVSVSLVSKESVNSPISKSEPPDLAKITADSTLSRASDATNKVTPSNTKISSGSGQATNSPDHIASAIKEDENKRGEFDVEVCTPRTGSNCNAVTPGAGAPSLSKKSISSNDSYIISASESSMECVPSMMPKESNSARMQHQHKTDGDSSNATNSVCGPRHFTFTESGLRNQAQSGGYRPASRQEFPNSGITGGTTITLTNPHGSAYSYGSRFPQNRPRSRSPVTTSRRGGRCSPQPVRGNTCNNGSDSRSSTPLNFASSPEPFLGSTKIRKGNKESAEIHESSAYRPSEAQVRQRPPSHPRIEETNGMIRRSESPERPSAAAAAAAAAAASNYYSDQRYGSSAPAVTPAERQGPAAGRYEEYNRSRYQDQAYERYYDYERHERYDDPYSAAPTARRSHYGGTDDQRLRDQYPQRIQTFSQSGSSGEYQESSHFPSPHDGSEEELRIRQNRYHMRYDHPGSRDHYESSRSSPNPARLSPNFTIYHKPTPHRPESTLSGSAIVDKAAGSSSKRGTIVLGGSTPIHITHHSGGKMKNYESNHGIGRSGGGSISSVFRKSSPEYPNGGHRKSRQGSNRFDKDENYDARGKSTRERDDRNAPSPSDMVEVRGPRSKMMRTAANRQNQLQNELSIADLPEDSPQRILLSMRTPSVGGGHSFDKSKSSDEEIKDASRARREIQSPPELLKRNNTDGFASEFFSDPANAQHQLEPEQKSPVRRERSFISSVPSNLHYTNSSGERIEIAPSFSLFNPSSFDSLGDCPQVQKNRGEISLTALGSLSNSSPSKEKHRIGQEISVGGVSSFGGLGNLSLGLGTQTMNMSRSESMGLLFSLSGTAPSFGGERSPTRPVDTKRKDVVELDPRSSRADTSRYPPRRSDQEIIRYDHSKPIELKQSRSSYSASRGAPSAQRNNSYGSQYSSGTNSSAPHIFYANICLAPNESCIPGFYHILVHTRHAFAHLTFLLPGLRASLDRDNKHLLVDVVMDPKSAGAELPDGSRCATEIARLPPLSESELRMARRRVIAAVCAFGGTNMKRTREKPTDKPDIKSEEDLVNKRQKKGYDEVLVNRYYENPEENRLSWDFEETPPVISAEEDEMMKRQQREYQANGGSDNNSPKTSSPSKEGKGSNPTSPRKESPSKAGQPKMRYRCKLCGQPKQNHICPYQSSLQRSIGITIYPALNAFTADEPGKLAPPLTDMNNFVSEDGSPERPSSAWSATASTPDSKYTPFRTTPSSCASAFRGVKTSISTPFGAIKKSSTRDIENASLKLRALKSVPRKRHVGQVSRSSSNEEMLFVEAMELKPEQFRLLTDKPTEGAIVEDCMTLGSYCYPQLPLPYSQRKGLSDTLFSLSKEVQHLTDECAFVLKEAREKDMWDLAVAELMTQVTVILHCPVGDNNLDGVRQYLLTLGIAC